MTANPRPYTDEYGEVINGHKSYKAVVQAMRKGQHNSAIVSWTDEKMTHLDILFTDKAHEIGGNMQRGIEPTDLFVAVMGKGAHGFKSKARTNEVSPQYVSEKLGFSGVNPTTEGLADLINGVIENL